MNITLNGEKVDIPNPSSLLDLLEKYGISIEKIATEIDGKIIPRSEYGQTKIVSGMKIEIIAFVGGG